MEQEHLRNITKLIAELESPASLSAVEKAVAFQRDQLREEFREEFRRSYNYVHIKLHPDLKKHGFEFNDRIKDTVASLVADVLIRDGCIWDHHSVVKIEPAVFLKPSESLRDSAVVIVHFPDGEQEHRSTSFSYR